MTDDYFSDNKVFMHMLVDECSKNNIYITKFLFEIGVKKEDMQKYITAKKVFTEQEKLKITKRLHSINNDLYGKI
jgi:hypothetical protein